MNQDLEISNVIDKNGNVSLSNLSADEIQQYESIANSIDENNPNAILNFGSELQNTLAVQSDSFLNSVRQSKSGEVGTLINNLLAEINYVDIDELEQGAFQRFISKIPFLRKLSINIKNIFSKYDSILSNVNAIANKVNAGIISSTKDNAMLQTLFETNVQSIKKLEEYIIAGNIRLDRADNELREMEMNKANLEDYILADKRDFITRLDRRLADLKVVRMILLQSLPQIRLIQNNNISIAEKAQTILTTTLPLWKNQLTLAVAMYRQQQHIEIQRQIANTTEEILRKNAEKLGLNSIEVAKANEETIVSIDTLRITTTTLVKTLKEVKQIQQQGMESRRKLDTDLQQLESELKANIQNI